MGFNELVKILDNVMGEVAEIEDKTAFKSLIGTVIDSWCALKGYKPDDAREILDDLLAVHAVVTEMMGEHYERAIN